MNPNVIENYILVPPSSEVTFKEGKLGEKLIRVVVIPLDKKPESVQIKDGDSGAWMTIYKGKGDLIDVTSVETVTIYLDIRCKNAGGWKIKTGLKVQALVIGE